MNDTETATLCPREASSRSLRIRAAAVLILAVASLVPAASAGARARGCARAHATIAATPRSALQRAVVCLVNQQRRERGLPSLYESPRLNRSAQGWTNTMVADRIFSHGADFAARISAAGVHWSSAGENIATGYATPAAVVRAWMASPGHCRNILNPTYRDAGTGVSRRAIAGAAGGGTWTQDFALPMGQRPASENWDPADGCPYP